MILGGWWKRRRSYNHPCCFKSLGTCVPDSSVLTAFCQRSWNCAAWKGAASRACGGCRDPFGMAATPPTPPPPLRSFSEILHFFVWARSVAFCCVLLRSVAVCCVRKISQEDLLERFNRIIGEDHVVGRYTRTI